MDMEVCRSPRRRALAVTLSGALVATGLSFVLATQLDALDLADPCGPGVDLTRMPDGSEVCVHVDEAPPGVDVNKPVSTAELKRRKGAGAKAYAAAEDLGVPTAVAGAATSPAVACEGDGDSGYRTQAMYVVESGKPNRFAEMKSSFQLWAAGVDDVINRSAALTGGVRNVRFVTEPGANGTCVAEVVNVTVPAGSMSSFNATISAVQAMGYTDANRKYLMWTDATGQCGIATMYPNDNPAQSNPNNGYYAQYSRIDTACWGYGNGSSQHSVEAHELVHNLGGVQRSAPHATAAGHCYDEADTMCYVDGPGVAMQNICPSQFGYLLDCRSDDYFSTYPEPGAYLDTKWNSADSRFLIGGGDGSGGGSAGAPQTLGARIAVNNPAVPGLATQADVTPSLPTGRTVASVAWKSARKDCTFSAPTEEQTQVTCAASATGATTVTATVTDSTGAVKSVTSPLTFATGTARDVTPVLSVAGQSSEDVSEVSMCTGAATPVSAVLLDEATGQPIKGLSASFTKQLATQTAPSTAGAGVTDASGRATTSQASKVDITYGVTSKVSKVYAAATPVTLDATVGQCSPTLTAAADDTDVYYGDPVTVTGDLSRDVNGAEVPVAGVSLPVTVTTTTTVNGRTTTKVATVGTAKTTTDGTYSVAVKPVTAGVLKIALPASAAYAATSVDLGDVTVTVPDSQLEAEVDRTDVGYGTPLRVTGHLDRIGAGTVGAPGMTVSVKVTAPGKPAVSLGSARTALDGSFTVTAPVRVSGALTAVYAGSAGLPAASADLGEVSVGTWDTDLSAAPAATTTPSGKAVAITGTLTRTYDGVEQPATGVAVKLYSRATGATRDTVASASVTAAGTFTFTARPRATTTYTVKVAGVAGYTDASVAPFTITVS